MTLLRISNRVAAKRAGGQLTLMRIFKEILIFFAEVKNLSTWHFLVDSRKIDFYLIDDFIKPDVLKKNI